MCGCLFLWCFAVVCCCFCSVVCWMSLLAFFMCVCVLGGERGNRSEGVQLLNFSCYRIFLFFVFILPYLMDFITEETTK